MSITVEPIEDPKSIEWNKLVAACPEGTNFQTTFWGEFIVRKFKDPKAVIYFVGRNKHGKVVSTALCWKEPPGIGRYLPQIMESGLRSAVGWAGFFNGICRYGPLVYEKNDRDTIIAAMLQALSEYMAGKGLLTIRQIIPPIHMSEDHKDFLAYREAATYSGYSNSDLASIIIDLNFPLEDLWRGLKHAARKAINSCRRHGLQVTTLKREDLPLYNELLRETRLRSKVPMSPCYPDENMWNQLRKDNSLMEIFAVRDEKEIHGALCIMAFNGIITEMCWAQSLYSITHRFYVGDLIRWAVIEWGHSKGMRLYDLSGVSPNPQTEKEQGIRRFKEKWGGKFVLYPSFSKVLKPNLHRCLTLGRAVAMHFQ